MVEQDAVVQTGEKSLTSHRIAHTFLLPETLLLVKLLSAFAYILKEFVRYSLTTRTVEN